MAGVRVFHSTNNVISSLPAVSLSNRSRDLTDVIVDLSTTVETTNQLPIPHRETRTIMVVHVRVVQVRLAVVVDVRIRNMRPTLELYSTAVISPPAYRRVRLCFIRYLANYSGNSWGIKVLNVPTNKTMLRNCTVINWQTFYEAPMSYCNLEYLPATLDCNKSIRRKERTKV